MHVAEIAPDQTDLLKKILSIHDEMPTAWNPEHRSLPSDLEVMLQKIQTGTEPEKIWVLSSAENPTVESIVGMLWAKVKKGYDGQLVCTVNSMWIHPHVRQQDLSRSLTDPCLAWAREQMAVRLECATHVGNRRMMEILEKHQFVPGMVSYSRKIAYSSPCTRSVLDIG